MPDSSYMPGESRIAAGTILPSRFVQSGAVAATPTGVTGTNMLLALQCTGPGVEILGIAHESTNIMMGTLTQTTLIPVVPLATAGQPLGIWTEGAECVLYVGSGANVTCDQLLVSDASGNGVPLTATGSSPVRWVGARAIESGTANQLIRVKVVNYPFGAPA